MHNHRLRWLCFIAFAAAMAMGAGDASQRFDKIGHQLICTCGCNQILLECNHVGCPTSGGMRDEISAGIARGDSNDLVLQNFVQKYGPIVLAAPTVSGFNRVAWITPFAVFVVGIGLVMLVVRSWRLRSPSVPVADKNSGNSSLPSAQFEAMRERARQETEL
jgi:cytochrome c-type biogenesis protein CcmH/NrfF